MPYKLSLCLLRLEHLLNYNTVTVLANAFAKRWIGFRLSIITTTFVCITALLVFLLRDEVSTSFGGAAIIYSFQVTVHRKPLKCVEVELGHTGPVVGRFFTEFL